MKKLLLFIISISFIATSTITLASDTSEVEINVMVVGSIDGGPLKSNRVGCAKINFKNISEKTIFIPMRPKSLGKGREESSRKPSYKNPKEGNKYGWGYSTALLIPDIAVQFEDIKGNIVKNNYPLLIDLPQTELSPGGYITGSCLFNTPDKSGTYNVRFIIDNRKLEEDTGYNSIDLAAKDNNVFLRKEIKIDNITLK